MLQKLAPPFTKVTVLLKVKAAENAWKTRNPEVVAMAYTEDSDWRTREEFFKGYWVVKTKRFKYQARKRIVCG